MSSGRPERVPGQRALGRAAGSATAPDRAAASGGVPRRSEPPDFVVLVDPPPFATLRGPLARAVDRLRPPLWGTVSFPLPRRLARSGQAADRPVRGQIILVPGFFPGPRAAGGGAGHAHHPGLGGGHRAGHGGGPGGTTPRPTDRPGARPLDLAVRHCLARTRRVRRAGDPVLGLSGTLAADPALARRLEGALRSPVSTGAPLAMAALLAASATYLRWLGKDPERAKAVVALGPGPGNETVDAVLEYLADVYGGIGVWGAEATRWRVVAERLASRTGAALEVYRSLEHCLEAADLVVLLDRARVPALADSGARARPLVVDLGRPAEAAGLMRLGAPVAASSDPPVLRGVLFAAPPGWSGRPEPGLPGGYMSAGLVATAARAACGRGPRAARPPLLTRLALANPRRLSAATLGASLALAASLGFHPAALLTARPDGGG